MLIPLFLVYRPLNFYSLQISIEWSFTLNLEFLLRLDFAAHLQAVELCFPRSALPFGLPEVNLSYLSVQFALCLVSSPRGFALLAGVINPGSVHNNCLELPKIMLDFH